MLGFQPHTTSIEKELLHLAGFELTSTPSKSPLEMLVGSEKPGAVGHTCTHWRAGSDKYQNNIGKAGKIKAASHTRV